MASRYPGRSPVALAVIVILHAGALALLFQYPPKVSSAHADVMHVSLITLPQPLQIDSIPEPPKPKPVKKVQRAVTPPALEAPSQTAISLPPAPPEPEVSSEPEVVASAPPPAPPAPIVLPRFDAAYLQNPPPVYPAQSRRTGEQGRVLLRVVVRPDGTPENVELRQSSGMARLDEAALDAVRKWRFVPARLGATPVTAAVIVPIVFSLEG